MSLAVQKLRELSDDPVKRRIADDRERDRLAHGHIIASVRDEGIAIGKEAGIAIGEERATRAAIETVVELLGVELSPTDRAALARATLGELRDRLQSLRAHRAWR